MGWRAETILFPRPYPHPRRGSRRFARAGEVRVGMGCALQTRHEGSWAWKRERGSRPSNRRRPMPTRKRKSSGRRYGESASKSVESAMRRRKKGTLKSGKSGHGGKVTSRKQAIAIGLSEARAKGAKVPSPKKRSSTRSRRSTSGRSARSSSRRSTSRSSSSRARSSSRSARS
ncbi:MAG TPA: DUF6496 domain-containing protein [Candidatus Eisenbacteria bacterium]|nr:DUF6496 domain-containing protein [Candidatus Eisenbacteria bacterium]